MIDPTFQNELGGTQFLERETVGAPCLCGGYMDLDELTKEELDFCKNKKICTCCYAAFVCRICKDRSTVHLNAPEMNF